MSEGSGTKTNFWPGFVDALGNVVIALIFVVIVLVVSLAYLAQTMVKRHQEEVKAQIEINKKIKSESACVLAAPEKPDSKDMAPILKDTDLVKRIVVKAEASENAASVPKITLKDLFLIVEFPDATLTVNGDAVTQVAKAMAGIKNKIGEMKAELIFTGPAIELSENQRAAYFRLMSVRNILIDEGMSPASISVRIDSKSRSNVASVNVSFKAKP